MAKKELDHAEVHGLEDPSHEVVAITEHFGDGTSETFGYHRDGDHRELHEHLDDLAHGIAHGAEPEEEGEPKEETYKEYKQRREHEESERRR